MRKKTNRRDAIRDDDSETCNQHPDTCSDPYCKKHN